MWDLSRRNRGIFVLISVLSGCAILYNAWGPILALTVSITLVIYVCYSLLTNDSILSPQTFVFIKYLNESCQEVNAYLNTFSFYLSSTIRKLFTVLNNKYRIYVYSKMNRFRQNTYQLSNDNRDASINSSSRFDLTTNQLSPISRNDYQENIRNDYLGSKLTSTPLLPPFRKENSISNGGIGFYTPTRTRNRHDATPSNYGPNHTSIRTNETVFSPEGSPWGTSISPKIRSKGVGIKTVQTIAGPLLASTRYNIDPKVYSDVTSPGLSSRLAKYATEASSKLTHQSQYGTGQFPKVNLSASPLPLISAKNAKIRTPVTVRIAPPDASRYSPPERQKLISDVCRAENRAAPSSVVQVLREISLKRHASREDVSSDLVKKQRTEDLFDENLDTLEDSKQKRTREDSPNTEEEILARNNQLRPVKKTKTPSCFDVLNSLSSSNQYSSGVKRKASTLDLSRSGTPDIEKHFKASEMDQSIPKISVNVIEPQTEVRKAQKHDLNEKSSPNMDVEVNTKPHKQTVVRFKGILKGQNGNNAVVDEQQNLSLERHVNMKEKEKETQIGKNSSPVRNKPVNFTDKLFMKAEPQANERLRTLIQEQGNIRAKFTTDDVDEIKKEDIVNMRQTSMRARLQSMFDAISGKPAKKINPDVIIHAEGASEPTTAQATPASLVTLSSTTSTTNINTSPIATSAVAPTVADSKLGNTTSTKHVTFNLPASQSSVISQSSLPKAISTTEIKTGTTETGNVNSVAPKLNFGTMVTTTIISTSFNVTGSNTLSFPNVQNSNATSGAVSSSANSNVAPSSFIIPTASIQNSTPSLGTPSVNVTSAANNNLNSVATTTTVKGCFPPSSMYTLSDYSSVIHNTKSELCVKPSTTIGAVTMPSSALSSGNFNSESNKSIELVKTSTQTSSPMPSFAFSAPKVSTTNSIFDGHIQTPSVNTQNQAATTNASVAPAKISSFVPSSVMQTSQSAFNANSITASVMVSANTTATTSSLFPFVGSTTAPQTTSAGSFSFTTNNTTTGKGQIPAFGNTSTQSTPPFGGTATQNPPSFGRTTNFPMFQADGSVMPNVFGHLLTGNQNPPAFGSAVTTAQAPPTFGTVTSSAPPPSFGNTSTTSSSFGFGNTAAPQQTSAISGFSTNTNSTAPSAVTNIYTTSNTHPTFSFGPTTTSTTKSGFPFGANTTTTASNPGLDVTGNSNQIPAFGATAASNIPPVFGTPSTTAPPAFGATSTTAPPPFGAPSTTAPPPFGAPSTTAPPAFGAPSTTATPVFGAPSSTATSAFGGPTTTATPAFGVTSSSTTTPLFGSPATTTTSAMFDGTVNQSTFGGVSSSGAPSGFGTPKTTAPPAFSSHISDPVFSYGGRNVLFSGTSLATTSNTAAPVTASSTFGGNAVSKSVFGQAAKPPPSFAASTSGNFATSGTPSFGNPGSTFGANSNSVPAGNASGFGTQSSTMPAFGTQNSTVKQTPQAPPPAFGSTNSAFGSTTTAPPAFGANTATPSGFGSATTTFGTQNTTAPPSFGASTGNAAPAFGTNVSAPFGGQSQTATPAFGAQNSTAPSFGATNNNSSATFGFGNNQTQPQQNSGFPFSGTASSANNNNTTTAAPFQFGGTAAKSEGFNFNASTTTPNMNFGTTATPSFGTPTQGSNMFGTPSPAVPAGGMFSIGAGSTAPRSRSSRTRRQR